MPTLGSLLTLSCCVGITLSAQSPPSQQQPVFRSAAEAFLIDLQVVSRSGDPILDLRPDELTIEIGGRKRVISSLQLLAFAPSMRAGSPPVASSATERVPGEMPRRRYIIAVDEHSFLPGSALAWKEAIKRFVAGLRPDDLAGLYAYPVGGPLVPLTEDRQVLLNGVDRIVGRLEIPRHQYNMSLSEAIDITAGDVEVAQRVAQRECSRPDQIHCVNRALPGQARMMTTDVEMLVSQSIGGLRTLMRSLKEMPDRKTVVVVSGGMMAGDRVGGRINLNAEIWEAGREASEANVNLYVLHLDTSFLEMFSARNKVLVSQLRDVELRAQGIARFAGAGGGELIRVQAGTGDDAFRRVLRETSAYYLLSVDVEERDRKDRAQKIKVKTSRRNAIVRHREWAVVPASR